MTHVVRACRMRRTRFQRRDTHILLEQGGRVAHRRFDTRWVAPTLPGIVTADEEQQVSAILASSVPQHAIPFHVPEVIRGGSSAVAKRHFLGPVAVNHRKAPAFLRGLLSSTATGAGDEDRTRDPLLGKQRVYHSAT